jgi:hypothetical protein
MRVPLCSSDHDPNDCRERLRELDQGSSEGRGRG